MPQKSKNSVEPKCPPGFILRKSYKTDTGKVVASRCIVDRSVVPKINNIKSNNKNVYRHLPQKCSFSLVLFFYAVS